MGDVRVVIQADDAALIDALRALLPDLEPEPLDRMDRAANLSMVGPGPDPDGPARKHFGLWRGTQEVVRARNLDRLLRAAVEWLEGFTGQRPSGLRSLRAMLWFGTGGESWLVPSGLRAALQPMEARLRRLGFRSTDGPSVDLDLSTAEVVVGHSLMLGQVPAAPDVVAGGRYRPGIVVTDWVGESSGRRAGALTMLYQAAIEQDAGALRALAQVVRRTQVFQLQPGGPAELTTQLRDVASRHVAPG